jgi:hypothetical protein
VRQPYSVKDRLVGGRLLGNRVTTNKNLEQLSEILSDGPIEVAENSERTERHRPRRTRLSCKYPRVGFRRERA